MGYNSAFKGLTYIIYNETQPLRTRKGLEFFRCR